MPCAIRENCSLGWVDIGIRTTGRLAAGEGSFCYKSLQNMAASAQVYTFRAMQYIWVKMIFSQYRDYGYQKTQNFT
jgi:hypothetical protein